MNKSDFKKPDGRAGKLCGRAMAVLGLMALLPTSNCAFGGEPPPTKYQVEAVCLFNFAKYVELSLIHILQQIEDVVAAKARTASSKTSL